MKSIWSGCLDPGCCTEAGDGGCRRMLTVRRTPADWLLQTTEAAWSPQPVECGTQHDLLVLVEQIVDKIAKYHMQDMVYYWYTGTGFCILSQIPKSQLFDKRTDTYKKVLWNYSGVSKNFSFLVLFTQLPRLWKSKVYCAEDRETRRIFVVWSAEVWLFQVHCV